MLNKLENKNLEKNKGITLIALVITIIVLLILAGVSIAMLTGDNGILTQAQNAKNKTEEAQGEEENILNSYESFLNSYSGENTEFTDSLGNIVKVPEGFRVLNPEDNVEDGIVIEDVVHENTKGSEFVWIPVGTIKTTKGDININLDRYIFLSNGDESGQGNEPISNIDSSASYLELSLSENGNIVANKIDEFISKSINSKGYYISRYEARDADAKKPRDSSTSDTNKLVCTKENYIYSWVTQEQAANLSKRMYNSKNFTSDLINSYAWDTAILFIQKCSKENDYSKKISVNVNAAPKGTNSEEIKDCVCNIFDMASNFREWTTETTTNPQYPCVARGGCYDVNCSTDARNGDSRGRSSNMTFRIILYL